MAHTEHDSSVRSCEVAVSHAGVILGIVSLPLSIAHVDVCAS